MNSNQDLETVETVEAATGIDSWEWEFKKILAERFGYVEQVWELKKKHGKPFHVQSQWDIIVNSAKEIGWEYKLEDELVEDIWNQIHVIAKQIEQAIEFDEEIVDDEYLYTANIAPLRTEILRLNRSLLHSVNGILSVHGEARGKRKIKDIIGSFFVERIETAWDIEEDYSKVIDHIVAYGEKKVAKVTFSKGDVRNYTYHRITFKHIQESIRDSMSFSETQPSSVVVINNEIYFLMPPRYGENYKSGHYLDKYKNEMLYTDFTWAQKVCPGLHSLVKSIEEKR